SCAPPHTIFVEPYVSHSATRKQLSGIHTQKRFISYPVAYNKSSNEVSDLIAAVLKSRLKAAITKTRSIAGQRVIRITPHLVDRAVIGGGKGSCHFINKVGSVSCPASDGLHHI